MENRAMSIELNIEPYSDEEMVFSNSKICHYNCEKPQCPIMTINRNPATDVYTLRCECGLKIEFSNNSSAETIISKCAISQEAQVLPDGAYLTNKGGPLTVSPWV
jgi:hypothetical protein